MLAKGDRPQPGRWTRCVGVGHGYGPRGSLVGKGNPEVLHRSARGLPGGADVAFEEAASPGVMDGYSRSKFNTATAHGHRAWRQLSPWCLCRDQSIADQFAGRWVVYRTPARLQSGRCVHGFRRQAFVAVQGRQCEVVRRCRVPDRGPTWSFRVVCSGELRGAPHRCFRGDWTRRVAGRPIKDYGSDPS